MEEDHKLLTNLCNNPVIFDQFKNWMEQMKVSAIMKLQTQLSQVAPDFEITPKRKEKPKEEIVDREIQLLAQNHSTAFTNQNTQISPQKINENSLYAKISKRNLN